MPVFDLYSKRRKAERDQPDVYAYDEIPEGLRVQIIHIWSDAIGNPVNQGEDSIRSAYYEVVQVLRREYQVFSLTKNNRSPHDPRFAFAELCEFFLAEKNTERVLDGSRSRHPSSTATHADGITSIGTTLTKSQTRRLKN